MNISDHHPPYLPSHVLDDGRDTLVNCLSFSPFGDYLASGREDGTIAIWDTQDGKYLHCIDVKSPVLCLAWDPIRRSRIFCGLQNGTVAFFDKFQGPAYAIHTGLSSCPAYAIVVEKTASTIAMAIGPEIHLAKKMLSRDYATIAIFPRPPDLPDVDDDEDNRVRGRSLHFNKEGSRLIVTYLNHGIVCWNINTSSVAWHIIPSHVHRYLGNSALSPDEKNLLVSNLDTGLHLYSVEKLVLLRTYHYTVNPNNNYPLAVAFLQDGDFVTCGAHTSRVNIWHTSAEEVFQTLEHNEPFVKCITSHQMRGFEYVATSTTGKPKEIRLWRAKIEIISAERRARKIASRWMALCMDLSREDALISRISWSIVLLGLGLMLWHLGIFVNHELLTYIHLRSSGLLEWFYTTGGTLASLAKHVLSEWIIANIRRAWFATSAWLRSLVLSWLDLGSSIPQAGVKTDL